MKFSVIVPIYNVEKYLEDCLNSILTQGYTDYELILVDDGSKDSCPQICDAYSLKDNRITVIHQKNGGLSNARNTGLAAAKGEYIVFVDSDDILYTDALEKVAKCIDTHRDIDILIGNMLHWNNDFEKVMIDNGQFIDEQQGKSILALNELYAEKNLQLPWTAYQSIYKNSFLKENGLTFKDGLVGAEDCEFYIRVIQKVKTYLLTDIILIKYRSNRTDSINNNVSYKSVMGQLETFLFGYLQADVFDNTKLMRKYFADLFTNILILINKIKEPQNREVCYQFVDEHKDILKYTSKKPKYIFAKIIWKLFGFPKGSNILLKIKK